MFSMMDMEGPNALEHDIHAFLTTVLEKKITNVVANDPDNCTGALDNVWAKHDDFGVYHPMLYLVHQQEDGLVHHGDNCGEGAVQASPYPPT